MRTPYCGNRIKPERRELQSTARPNSEAIELLRAAVMVEPIDVEALIARARAVRQRAHGELTDELLDELKREGRA